MWAARPAPVSLARPAPAASSKDGRRGETTPKTALRPRVVALFAEAPVTFAPSRDSMVDNERLASEERECLPGRRHVVSGIPYAYANETTSINR